MAVAAWKQCFKFCGYLCGALAALNIWFWIGMTIFQAAGNPYITEEVLLLKFTDYKSDDATKFVTVFAVCIAVSFFLCSMATNRFDNDMCVCLRKTAEPGVHAWLLLLHKVCLLPR